MVEIETLQLERAIRRLSEAVNDRGEDTERIRESLATIAEALTDEQGPLHRIAAALEAIGKQSFERESKRKRKNLKAVGA